MDAVLLTHLHTDHIGWAAGALFPNARHVLQRADVDALGKPLGEALLERGSQPTGGAGDVHIHRELGDTR